MKTKKTRTFKTPLQQYSFISVLSGLIVMIGFLVWLFFVYEKTTPFQIPLLICGLAAILKYNSNEEYYAAMANRFIPESDGHTFRRHFIWMLKEIRYRENGKLFVPICVFFCTLLCSFGTAFAVLFYISSMIAVSIPSGVPFWCVWILAFVFSFINFGKWSIIRILKDYDEQEQLIQAEAEEENGTQESVL